MKERVLFKKGQQRKFLDLVKERLNCGSVKGILQFGFDIPYSTLKNYYSECLLLPRDLFEDLCYISKVESNKLDVEYLKDNWGQIKGGRKGIRIMMKKYPEEIKKWRKLGTQNSPITKGLNLKKIYLPKINEKLSEFLGAYLGDGTLTRYFIRISGGSRYESSYYNYLSKLVFELFGINAVVSKEKKKNTLNLRASSKKLCSFFHTTFNLEYGHKIKNNTIIPKKILNSKRLSIACLRGLVDTDGSISKRGNQFSIQFTSHNKLLLNQVYSLGERLGIFTFYSGTGTGTNKWENIVKYFNIVGSSNLKHIIRFHIRNYEGKSIYTKELPFYFKQNVYKDINFPFRILGV